MIELRVGDDVRVDRKPKLFSHVQTHVIMRVVSVDPIEMKPITVVRVWGWPTYAVHARYLRSK